MPARCPNPIIRLAITTLESKTYFAPMKLAAASEPQLQDTPSSSDAFFHRIADKLSDAIVMIDDRGRINYWNQKAEAIFGFSAKEALGREMHSLLASARSREACQTGMARLRESGECHWAGKAIELNACRKGGGEFPIELSLTPVSIVGSWRAVAVIRDVSERKQMEAALLQSELNYRELFNSTSDGMCVIDPKSCAIIDVSEKMIQDLGYRREEARQLGIDGISLGTSPYSVKEAAPLIQAAAQEGSQIFEWQARRKSGELFWTEVFLKAAEINGQRRVLAFARDITKRKQAEADLRWRSALFEAMVDASLDGILVVDKQGRKICQNQRAIDLWQVPASIAADPSDAKQARFAASRTKNARLFAEKAAWLYAHPEASSRNEIELMDGTVLDVYSSPVRDKQGNYYGRIWNFRDITERKQAEWILRDSQADLEQIFQASPLATSISSWPDARMLAVNQSWIRMFGFTLAEAAGRQIAELGLWAKPEQRSEMMACLAREGAVQNFEFQIQTKAGEIRDGLLSAVMVQIRGQPCLITNIADITEKKQLEAKFLQTQRLDSIGSLASGIAHDLNNILAPILMCAGMLRMDETSMERGEMLHTIESSAQRAVGIVRQLLGIARAKSSHKEPIPVGSVVDEMVKLARATFPCGIRIEAIWSPDLWSVLADVTQIHQVLLNLCINARDAMPSGGTLSLYAENVLLDEPFVRTHREASPGPHVRIRVQDTGTGIPDALQTRVFEAFFTTKAAGQGTGLGLATVRGIVKDHNGFITFTSAAGKGTVFAIYLPAILETQAREEPRPIENTARRGQGELVLVVDDEPAICKAMSETLARNGYAVLTAGSGAEALAQFSARQKDVRAVVTDCMMPLMNGLALCRRLRALSPALPVVVSSGGLLGEEGNETRRALEQLGIRHFLHKPHTADMLLSALGEIFQPTAGSSSSTT